jgi:hypothetical protein
LQWWSIPRRGWIIILAELVVIVTLAGWVYSEYVNNTYFQIYVNGLSPILLPIVSVGFGVSSATIATLLYFTMRNVRHREGLREGDSPRRHVPARRAVKKPMVTSTRTEKPTTGGLAMGPRARPPVTGVSSSKRGTDPDSGNEGDESG